MSQVSVVVPALDEAAYLGACLDSIRAQDVDAEVELIVVDGGSTDGTRDIAREYGATVLDQDAGGIGAARDQGARYAAGGWLAFVDADTTLAPSYLRTMTAYLEGEDLAAGAARCRVVGAWRGKAMQAVINHVFPRLGRPVLPGFNTVVRADAYAAVGGYPDVPNEDTAFSRRLGHQFETGYHPAVLVETAGRRFARSGLTGALIHYLRLDVGRVRSNY